MPSTRADVADVLEPRRRLSPRRQLAHVAAHGLRDRLALREVRRRAAAVLGQARHPRPGLARLDDLLATDVLGVGPTQGRRHRLAQEARLDRSALGRLDARRHGDRRQACTLAGVDQRVVLHGEVAVVASNDVAGQQCQPLGREVLEPRRADLVPRREREPEQVRQRPHREADFLGRLRRGGGLQQVQREQPELAPPGHGERREAPGHGPHARPLVGSRGRGVRTHDSPTDREARQDGGERQGPRPGERSCGEACRHTLIVRDLARPGRRAEAPTKGCAFPMRTCGPARRTWAVCPGRETRGREPCAQRS